jgi:hypothetical protein
MLVFNGGRHYSPLHLSTAVQNHGGKPHVFVRLVIKHTIEYTYCNWLSHLNPDCSLTNRLRQLDGNCAHVRLLADFVEEVGE